MPFARTKSKDNNGTGTPAAPASEPKKNDPKGSDVVTWDEYITRQTELLKTIKADRDEYKKQVDKRFDGCDKRLDTHRDELTVLNEDVKDLRNRINVLEKTRGSQPPTPAPTNPKPNLSVTGNTDPEIDSAWIPGMNGPVEAYRYWDWQDATYRVTLSYEVAILKSNGGMGLMKMGAWLEKGVVTRFIYPGTTDWEKYFPPGRLL